MSPESIFTYVKGEEAAFETDEVRVGDNWNWNFRNHIQLILHLKNGQFFTGENDYLRAFKNIMEPMLNLAYWSEDIEVKDVVFFIENSSGRVLSFLIKKYHDEVYVRENDLDTLFDEITESDIDYGGVLVQKGKQRPEVLPLSKIAFCDQNDILAGPIGIKHNFSPDALRKMASSGWGSDSNGATISIDELIMLAHFGKDPDGVHTTKENKTTGKNIEVYVVRGSLPEHYLLDNDNMEDYYNQVHVVAFYHDKENKVHGVTLFRKKESEENLKFHTSQKIQGRALGRGEGEALVHPQIWTNFLTIHKTNMLEAGSKVPLWTDDDNLVDRNHIQNMDNLEVVNIEEGRSIGQIPTAAVSNIQLFEKSINEWFEQAQLTGSAFDPILGKEPVSGTTFRGQERTVAQGRGLHDRRRGQRAKFIELLYREFIIPNMVKKILDGKEFMATLSTDEMEWISDQLAENHANREVIEDVLNLQTPRDKELLKQDFKEKFSKSGNKRMIKILKDEFRGVEVKMGINIAGKQKELALLSDKVLSIFQFIIANPQGFQQAMQIPGMARSFQDVLEFSGMNNVDFTSLAAGNLELPQPQQPQQPVELPKEQTNVV